MHKLTNRVTIVWLLTHELVAGKQEDPQSRLVVPIKKYSHLFIVSSSQATMARHIDDHEHFTAIVVAKTAIVALHIYGRKIVDIHACFGIIAGAENGSWF